MPGSGALPVDTPQTRYFGFKVHTAAAFVACPLCAAVAGRPCRTLEGKMPGRITSFHTDRYHVAAGTKGAELSAVADQMLEEVATVIALPHTSFTGPDMHARIVRGDYDEAGLLRTWLLCVLSGLVACSSCGAAPAEPCRTGAGKVPGRITSTHKARGDVLTGKVPTLREINRRRAERQRARHSAPDAANVGPLISA